MSPAAPPEHRQHEALDDQLPDQTSAAGAERRAQRELAAAAHTARHQQAGEIHTRDDEHRRDNRHQQPQCRAALL